MSNQSFEHLKKRPTQIEIVREKEFKFFTVRLEKSDAIRFKRAAEDNGYKSNQSALIDAINKMMGEWAESPVVDNGSAGKS